MDSETPETEQSSTQQPATPLKLLLSKTQLASFLLKRKSDIFNVNRVSSKAETIKGLNRITKKIRKIKKQDTEVAISYSEKSEEESEINSFIILTSFKTSDFHHKWAVLIFLVNIYNFFNVAFWLGVPGFPSGVWMGFEIVSEVIMLTDAIGRIRVSKFPIWKKQWMLHDVFDCNRGRMVLLIASLPYSIICYLTIGHATSLHEWWIAVIRLPKLLRYPQFNTFFSTQKLIWKAGTLSLVQYFQLMLLLVGLTHFTGSAWLFVSRLQNLYTKKLDAEGFWYQSEAKDFENYVDACFWSTCTLCGIGFSNVIPTTSIEIILSLVVMLIGSSVYAAVFGALVVVLDKMNSAETETQSKLTKGMQWAKVRGLPNEIRLKIHTYFTLVNEKYSNIQTSNFLNNLPTSLRTEISLYLHRDMLQKVKLFELGDPAFMLAIIRYLTPKLYMAGDFIMREDEYADEWCFIRTGCVEVIATDGETIIAVLDEGCYFGEIGCLLQDMRSVSVRAKTACLISSISKKDLKNILKNFPEQHEFLRKVALQRLETTHLDDIDLNFDIDRNIERSDSDSDSSSSDDSFDKPAEDLRCNGANLELEKGIKTETTLSFKQRLCKDFCAIGKIGMHAANYIIDPLSKFNKIWSVLITLSFAFYLFYAPLSLSFEYEASGFFLACDIISYIIYVFDIFIRRRTSLHNEYGEHNRDLSHILYLYMNSGLLSDIVSALPADYVTQILNTPQYVTAILIRLVKVKRVYKIMKFFQKNHRSAILSKLITYFIMFLFNCHLSACLFYLVARMQYELNPDERFDGTSFFSRFGYQVYRGYGFILDLPIKDRYIHLLYLATYTSGAFSYGEDNPETSAEKFTIFCIMIYSKFFVALVYAEAANVVYNYHATYMRHLKKLTLVKEWMAHLQLPKDLQLRVLRYYDSLWSTLKGYDDSDIMNDLPSSLRSEISLSLFSSFATSEIFPAEEQGAILTIVRKCKLLMVCKDEFIVVEGELGLDMYFIIEGEVEIIQNGLVLNTLGKGKPFGEMALLKEKPTVRGASVRAKTDVSLAVLSLEDFQLVMQNYPEFSQKVRSQADERKKMNKATIRRASMMAQQVQLTQMIRNISHLTSLDEKEEEYEEESPSSPEIEDQEASSKLCGIISSIRSPVKKEGEYESIESDPSKSEQTSLEILDGPVEIYPHNKILPMEKIVMTRSNRPSEISSSYTIQFIKLNKLSNIWIRLITYDYEYIVIVEFLVTLWNYLFVPFQIAFELNYEGFKLGVEIVYLLYMVGYISYAVYTHKNHDHPNLTNMFKKSYFMRFSKSGLRKEIIFKCIISFPFAMIFDRAGLSQPRELITIFSLIRLADPRPFYMFFRYLSHKKMNYLHLIRLIEAAFYYLILVHVLGSMFIEVAKIENDDTKSWLRRLPVPRNDNRSKDSDPLSSMTIYVHAIYWAVLSTSHIGNGDVSGVTINEKAYACFVIAIGTFGFAILFGNIASLVTSISERLKDKLTNSYLYVADFLVKKKIYKNLGKQVDDYFKYIWSISIGIDENEILNELPPNIVSDIQLFRYKHTLSDSSVFKDAAGNVNLPLARSILRLIHVRCYMVGEAIIQSGDKTNEIYILLDGELKVFNIKGSRIITTLKSGAHFGEISGLLDWATSRTASVVCTSVCRIGVLEVSKFKLLIEAYPEWHKMLLDIAIGRMKEEFHTSDITILRQRYTKVADSYNNNPKKSKKAIERREQILNPLIARLLEESSDGNFALEVIHLGLILYSCCSIPLEVGFNLIDNQFLQAMDGICLCESIIYIIYNFRSIVKQEGKGMKCMELLRFYKDNYMLEDILACSPFKLVFNLLSITEPQFIVTPLRLLRLASLTRIPSLLEKVQTHYRNWSSYINTFRALFFLSLLWHVSSCMWFYVNLMIEKDLDNRWMDYNNLTDVSKLKQYLHAIYFTMNIVSGVAYGDMFPTTDTERVATIIIILMGDALFASAFGLMASLAGSTPKGFAEYLESAKLTSEHLNLEQLHSSLYRRIEQYYAYKWSLVQRLGPTNSTDLYDHLPKNMVERIMYECNKEMIHSVPIFQKSEKTTLIASVATKLKPQFYLPSDYVIYKDDIGEEMYFIVEGVVNVMTPDCRKVVKELGKGSYVGEISLMTEERRMCSVIAKTFCFMYLLSKEDFLSIVEDHPDINEELFREGQIRKRESFDRGSRFRTSFVDEEEKGDLSFRKESVSVKRESVLGKVFGFMQTSESRIQSEDEIRSEWITEGSKSRKISEGMYEEQNTKKARRRPHITKKRMRRYSMLSLRKEVVLSKFTNLKMQWTMDAN